MREIRELIVHNVTDCDVNVLRSKRVLIIDRDAVLSPRFQSTLGCSGVEVLWTAYQAPNMNAHRAGQQDSKWGTGAASWHLRLDRQELSLDLG